MKAPTYLKTFFLCAALITHQSKGYSQQLLWTTASDAKEKKIPKSQVVNEVLKQYDFYEYYIDATGYTQESFASLLKGGKGISGSSTSKNPKVDARLAGIKEPTIFAWKDNTGTGSLVMILSIDGDNIDMLVFFNNSEQGSISTAAYKRKKFINWIKSVFKLETNFDEQNEKNSGSDTLLLSPPILTSELSFARSYQINDNINSIEPPTKKIEDIQIEKVAVKASFPGGESAFRDYVGNEFQYPKRCQDEHINGSVILKFVVDASGRISRVSAIQETKSCPEFTLEAIRVLKQSPLWIPGQNKGRFVASWREIPIRLSTE